MSGVFHKSNKSKEARDKFLELKILAKDDYSPYFVMYDYTEPKVGI